MEWIDVNVAMPPKAGWYAAAVNPVNFEEFKGMEHVMNSWRRAFGFSKVWYNPGSVDRWYEADFHGKGSVPVGGRVTHWGVLPTVPDL